MAWRVLHVWVYCSADSPCNCILSLLHVLKPICALEGHGSEHVSRGEVNLFYGSITPRISISSRDWFNCITLQHLLKFLLNKSISIIKNNSSWAKVMT